MMPEVISVKRLIKIFEDIHHTKSETQVCFILGAGASKSSGIRTGSELARLWYQELQDMYPKGDFEDLLKQHGIVSETPEQFYSELYALRYKDEPSLGYDFINKEMDNIQPSYGYTVLAQILSTTRHNIVISTNFDNLVEFSLYIYTGSQPLICAHESLAKYARPSSKMPIIAKIHRGREYDPYSKSEEIKELVSEWIQPLKELLNNRIIVCIGYGGNDGSLMGFLEKIDTVKGIYWCVRGKEMPNKRVQDLLDNHNGKIVETEGFDEFMFELQDKLELGLIDTQIENVAKDRATSYRNKVEEIKEKNKLAADPDKKKAAENITSKAHGSAWRYILAARDASTFEQKEKILLEGLKSFPQEAALYSEYAYAFITSKNKKEANQYYLKAIELAPLKGGAYNNYALFLANIMNDLKSAEEWFLKGLELMPDNALINSNYAVFLDRKLNEEEKAELFYKRALSLSPENTLTAANYAGFLFRKNRLPEAGTLIDKVIRKNEVKQPLLKALFFKYLYFPEAELKETHKWIKELLDKGLRVWYYDFSDHVETAIKLGHPNPKEARRLAQVIVED